MEFENDLGKPWKYQDGDFTVVRSSIWSPPGCHPVGCQVKLYVDKDGRLDHVEGDENDPVTHGRLRDALLSRTTSTTRAAWFIP